MGATAVNDSLDVSKRIDGMATRKMFGIIILREEGRYQQLLSNIANGRTSFDSKGSSEVIVDITQGGSYEGCAVTDSEFYGFAGN